MSLAESIRNYLKWAEREKWLSLREVAYEHLRDTFFSSSASIDSLAYLDFKKHYLGFCSVVIRGFEYKLTVNTISDFLQKYTASELKELIANGELDVIGNASWSQLHMGTKKEKWHEMRKAMKFLLFGDDEKQIREIETAEVLDRLRIVMEGNLSVKGFSRAKITPLLLICDSRDRFGVWNSVSGEALYRLGLKPKGSIEKSRQVSEYLAANRALNKLKNDHRFRNLADVDIFVWYYLEQMKSQRPYPLGQIERLPSPASEPIENPLIQTAIFSMMNALECFQRGEERHRQGAMIFMDQAAEYILKAKLYQVNHVRLIERQLEKLTFEQAVQEVEKYAKLLNEDKFHLRKVHRARNYAQHRAVIPDSSWTREYINWIYKFFRRFAEESFRINIDSRIPPNLRRGL